MLNVCISLQCYRCSRKKALLLQHNAMHGTCICSVASSPDVMAPHTSGALLPGPPCSMAAVMATTSASICLTAGKTSACRGLVQLNSVNASSRSCLCCSSTMYTHPLMLLLPEATFTLHASRALSSCRTEFAGRPCLGNLERLRPSRLIPADTFADILAFSRSKMPLMMGALRRQSQTHLHDALSAVLRALWWRQPTSSNHANHLRALHCTA